MLFGTRPVADRTSGTTLTCPIRHCILTSHHHLRYLWILLYTVSVYTAVYTTKLSLVFNERNVAPVALYFISYKFLDPATSVLLSFYRTPFLVGRDSAVGTATRYGLEVPEIESRWELNIPHPCRADMRPTQPPILTIGTGLFPGVKRPGSSVDPPPSSGEVKKRVQLYLYPRLPPPPSLHGLFWG